MAEPDYVTGEMFKRYGDIFTRLHLYLKAELDREVIGEMRQQILSGT